MRLRHEAHAHALRTPPLHHVEMAPVTGIPVGESFGGQSQAAAVIAAAREAENFSRNLRAVAERETRAFSVSIDGAVRQAQKRVDERVDAAIAARVEQLERGVADDDERFEADQSARAERARLSVIPINEPTRLRSRGDDGMSQKDTEGRGGRGHPRGRFFHFW